MFMLHLLLLACIGQTWLLIQLHVGGEISDDNESVPSALLSHILQQSDFRRNGPYVNLT